MNYYEILELSPNASKEVIKAAYKSLMQRYHPDKNPDNAEIAERASLVVQAYEVLSDPDQRAAYDLQFKEPLISSTNPAPDSLHGASIYSAYARGHAVKESNSYWYVWLLIILIIFSGWVILSLTKKRLSPESELKEIRLSIAGKQLTQEQLQNKLMRMDAILKASPEILRKEASAKANEEAARTIPIFITQLTVHLFVPEKAAEETGKELVGALAPSPLSGDSVKPMLEATKVPVDSGHVLLIPVLGVKVGSFDPEKVIRHLESKTEFISQQLAEKLAYAKYDELVKIDGEQYLQKLILDAIGDTTGTNRFEEYPSANGEPPSRYGVVEVFFPESYAVR